MIGIPCAHAFSTILYDSGKPEEYVDNYYSVEMLKKKKKTYDPIIYPMHIKEKGTNNGKARILFL